MISAPHEWMEDAILLIEWDGVILLLFQLNCLEPKVLHTEAHKATTTYTSREYLNINLRNLQMILIVLGT